MSNRQPQGDLAVRTLAMPGNTNPNGDIFGGWVVSHMDLAATSVALKTAGQRVATRAIDKLSFIAPVYVGDFICCYAQLIKIGQTSMTISIEVWAIGSMDEQHRQVAEGVFTFVAIDEKGRPRVVKQ